VTTGISRANLLASASAEHDWEVLVIGGGATGLGTALEASSRGYRTLLLEAKDFAQATSSRSTKLVHGGVRYLKQGNLKLVLEALRERGRMLRNAPHLVHRQTFVIPAYRAVDLPFYGAGLTVYDLLAGRESLGRSRLLSPSATRALLPTLGTSGLKGGVLYYDGQFDDARYAIALMQTIIHKGGVALNYIPVCRLMKHNGNVSGVEAEDSETGLRFEFRAKCVINATGIFTDEIRRLDEPQSPPMLRVSQGSHIVLPARYLPGDAALMIPKTSDRRVLFAVPWYGSVVVGTTEEGVPAPSYEPRASARERAFLAGIEQYLGCKLRGEDVQSVWSGQRPLVQQTRASGTASIPRDHTIVVSPSKLVTITGGKWTTYRKMGQDAVDTAVRVAALRPSESVTAELPLWRQSSQVPGDSEQVQPAQSESPDALHSALPFRKSDVLRAAEHEMARTVEDVLARRTRALFLNARASIEAAPETARLLSLELDRDEAWQQHQVESFRTIARQYMWND
jgi:glycerol-3-phosphate dehydrogenase